jgi:hypothetical protein
MRRSAGAFAPCIARVPMSSRSSVSSWLPRDLPPLLRGLCCVPSRAAPSLPCQGVLLDHGTGVVIGETAVLGNNVSILQNVTLGGTGKEIGDRHPKVRCALPGHAQPAAHRLSQQLPFHALMTPPAHPPAASLGT